MNELSALLCLFLYVIGHVKERCVRHIARRWNRGEAVVTRRAISGEWGAKLEIDYSFEIDGQPHAGEFRRRYMIRRYAEIEPAFEDGARIEILVDPKNLDRSYFPLPLGRWGFVYAASMVLLLLVMPVKIWLTNGKIPEAEWRPVRYSRLFQIRFPGDAVPMKGIAEQMALAGNRPDLNSWFCQREGYYFQADYYEYPTPPVPDEVFALVRSLNQKASGQNPSTEHALAYSGKRAGKTVRWPDSTGRRFEYSHPDRVVEVYVSGRSACVMSTNWYAWAGLHRFFDSRQPTEDLN
ncbi:MAG TPA: hypothetical protein VGR73_16705 [Bryobacteraceae bacterium]|nr:hypothetical protein [Bryobacteraceae bacterium]